MLNLYYNNDPPYKSIAKMSQEPSKKAGIFGVVPCFVYSVYREK